MTRGEPRTDAGKPKPKGRTWSAQLTVVGMNHRLTQDGRKLLSRHCPLPVRIEREPENPAHDNAIKVLIAEDNRKLQMLRGTHIGYLRANIADLLAPLLDSGKSEPVNLVMVDVEVLEGQATIEGRFRDRPLQKGGKRKSSRRA